MKLNKFTVSLALMFWAMSLITTMHAQLSNGNSKIPFHEEVRTGKLPNGMEYYLLKNEKPENRAELRLALKAGAINEDDDQQGIAHFVEHMCFNGSKNFTKNELVNYLEKVGTKFGPDLNAYTSFDETVYMLQVRTDDEEQYNKGLLVMEDWAGGVVMEDTEIDKERGVVESEWRTRLSPEQRMQGKYFPVQYAGSKYANRLPIGQMEIIRNAPYDNFKRFYSDWYRPNLMALIVVGDIDMDATEKKIIASFSKLQNPNNERPRENFTVPKHDETRIVICSDKEATNTSVSVRYKNDYRRPQNIEDFKGMMAISLYNDMINARLNELAQKPEPPFNFAYSYYGQDVGELSSYNSYAQTKDGATMSALQTLLEENEKVKRFGFNESEMERVKMQMMRNAESAFQEKDKTDNRDLVMGIVYHFLEGAPFLSPAQDLKLYKELLPLIKIEEVNVLAKRYITDKNRTVVVTSPDKPGLVLPTKEEVYNLVNTIKDMRLDPYVDKINTKPFMANKPAVGKIIKSEDNVNLGTTTWLLSNGAKVTLKPTKFKNDEILFGATSEGGSSLYSDKDNILAQRCASIIAQSGLGDYNQTDMDKFMTGKQVSLFPYVSLYREGLNGSASPKDMEIFFQMLNQIFTAPRKDRDAFESYKNRSIAQLKNYLADPQRYFGVESSKIKTQNNVRTKFDTAEDIAALDLDRMFEIYKERFGNASDFNFFFTGAFTLDEIKPFVETYIASLPGSNKSESMKDVGIRYPSDKVNSSWAKGEAPKSNVDLTFHAPFTWNDRNRYVFNSMVDVLRIKLREALREDKGGVYGVNVYGNPSNFPINESFITVSFNCTPGREQELIAAAMEVINKIKANGAEESDMTKVTEIQRQERIKQLEENQFWSRGLRSATELKFNPEILLIENYEKFIKGLSADDIKNAANSYLDEKTLISITGKPEEKPIKP